MLQKALLFAGVFLFSSTVSVFSQATPWPTPPPMPRTVPTAGVEGGDPIEIPEPEYPAEARKTRAQGAVNVEVLVNEEGKVLSAKVLSGDTLFHRAAREAAMKARYQPTTLSGTPVKVNKKISFNFVFEDLKSKATPTPAPPPSYAGPAPGSGDRFTVKGPDDWSDGGKKVSGGVLNQKATLLPKPVYPPAAREVKAQGAVVVQVLVDEEGNVMRTLVVSGNPLLRDAAVTAAKGAKFAPMLLEGKPIKVSGVIVYNFVSGASSPGPSAPPRN